MRGSKDRKTYCGVYGNTRILKGYCWACDSMAFVIDGELQCCNRPFEQAPEKFKRECSPEQERRLPPLSMRQEQLARQENRCFYCNKVFGTHVIRGLKLIVVRLNWDHYAPYSYSQDNHGSNFVAACSICNGIKSDLMFQTSGEAIVYVLQKRNEKGYID